MIVEGGGECERVRTVGGRLEGWERSSAELKIDINVLSELFYVKMTVDVLVNQLLCPGYDLS